MEDLTKAANDVGAKVRMRIVLEVDVPEDDFIRDAFNEAAVEMTRVLDVGDAQIVLLTTEELTA